MTEITNEDLLEKLNEVLDQGDVILEAIGGEWTPTDPDSQEPPTPDPDPLPNLPYVTMREDAPLMEVGNYDDNNKIVLRLHKFGLTRRGRILGKEGKRLYHIDKVKTAQGIAFKLSPLQEVDGKSLTIGSRTPPEQIPGTRNPREYDKHFYILKRLVKV